LEWSEVLVLESPGSLDGSYNEHAFAEIGLFDGFSETDLQTLGAYLEPIELAVGVPG
jgi:hypothetical protein